MKEYVIPYLIGKNKNWWAGVDIYNHHDTEMAITISAYRYCNSKRSRLIQTTLPAYRHYLLTPTEIDKGLYLENVNKGRASIHIIGPDNLMITPFHGMSTDGKPSGFGILNVFENTRLREIIRPNFKNQILQFSETKKTYDHTDGINASQYYVYGGKLPCSYMYSEFFDIVNLVAQSIYYDFPDAKDRRLSIGDCCPFTGNCPGHPAHANLQTLDQNYYTTGKNNTTQYRPGQPGDDCYEITKIWQDGFPGEALIEHIFDWQRNFLFYWRLHQIFPDLTILTNENIQDCIVWEARNRYGRDTANKIIPFLQGEEGTSRNHHIHTHIYLGTKINWDFNTQDFLGA